MITIFEKYKKYVEPTENLYWLVPTDKRFRRSLVKIGCSPSWINFQVKNSNILEHEYAYIAFITGGMQTWNWMPSSDGTYFERNWGCKFMGSVNIEPFELDGFKYNL
jgi:hypothetical protein